MPPRNLPPNSNVVTEGELTRGIWVTVVRSREEEQAPPPFIENPQGMSIAIAEAMSNRNRRPTSSGLPALLSSIETDDLLGVPLRVEAIRLPFVVCSSVAPFAARETDRCVMDVRRYLLQRLTSNYVRAFSPRRSSKKSTSRPPDLGSTSLASLIGSGRDISGESLLKKLRPPPGDKPGPSGEKKE